MQTYVKIRPFAFGPYDVEDGENPQVWELDFLVVLLIKTLGYMDGNCF